MGKYQTRAFSRIAHPAFVAVMVMVNEEELRKALRRNKGDKQGGPGLDPGDPTQFL